MSVHLFQQWVTDIYIYKYTCTGYGYIINKKVQTQTAIQTESWTKYFEDRYLPCTLSD